MMKGDGQRTLRQQAMRLGTALKRIDEARSATNDVLAGCSAMQHLDAAKKSIAAAREKLLDLERKQQGEIP